MSYSCLQLKLTIKFSEAKLRDHRVIGEFVPGVNAPRDVIELQQNFLNPAQSIQVQLDVNQFEGQLFSEDYRLVWLQFLLDSRLKEKRFATFNLWQLPVGEDPKGKQYTAHDFKRFKRVSSLINPISNEGIKISNNNF